MNSDRLLIERIEHIRLKERRRQARNKQGSDAKEGIELEGSSKNQGNGEGQSRTGTVSLNDILGPLENYMHLLDPAVQDNSEGYVSRAQQIVEGLGSVADVAFIIDTCRLLTENKANLDGDFLERLMAEVKNLAVAIERSPDDPV